MKKNDKKNIYRSIRDESLSTAQLGGSLDSHLDCGYYLVEINNKDRLELGLPVDKCGNEHYLKAHLFVTDSGNEDELQKNRVIGQTLVLSQCDDGKTSIYSRSYSSIGDGYKWSLWSKAQQDVQVGQVTSLDGFTSSGLYSGVYSVAGRSPETFVLTVIDNSTVAIASSKTRSISQFKYAVNVEGTFSYRARVGSGDGKIEWGSWTDVFSVSEPSYDISSIVPKIINPPTVANINPEMKSWVNNDTAGVVTDTPVLIYDEVYQIDRQSVELTSTDRARFISPFNIGVDFTTNVLRGSFCIQKDYPVEHIGVFDIELYSNNLINADNRATFQIYYGNMSDADYNARYVRSGWFHFCVNPDALIKTANRGFNFDITNVTHVGVHPFHTKNLPLKVFVGDFSVVRKLLKPGVVTIVDNFDASVPAMADYAYSKGVKLNLSIVPNWIEKGSGSATLEEINRIKRQGHFIFSHTFDHITDTSDMTELQIVEEITKGAEWMQNNGFNRGKFVVSNPSAMFPLAKYEAYMESPLQMLYHHWVSCPSGVSNGILLYYPYYPMSRLLNISSLDKCDDAILIAGKAKEKGGIAVNGYHGTFWSADGGTQWKKYIDAIAELDVKHYGIDELIEGIAI